ncbi:MAG: amino acid adenylation domain-containing protein [Gammaproteobacteria bacterium]|nr:amino acid adenylation domain-containing protein [Gammaproteobacteria bacterium]
MTTQNTIHQLFEAQAVRHPDQIAIICADHTLTYRQLNNKANQLAHYLQKNGVKPASHVAICMERSIELLVTILAILKAGAAYVPLDASHPAERLLFILQDNLSPTLITTSHLQDNYKGYQGHVIALEREMKIISKEATDNLNLTVSAQELAYMIYTSGSTGRPKGVLIEHGSVVNYAKWFADYSGCQPQQRVDFSSNHVFDMAVTTSIVPLMLGLTLVLCLDDVKTESRRYLKHLAKQHITMLKATPSYFKVLLHEATHHFIALPHLKQIILGGEALFSIDCASWLALYPKHVLFNEYGPTEATVAVSQYKISKKTLSTLGAKVPIGSPGLNMSCHLLSVDLQPIQDGEVGELYIGGAGLARGYWNQPELTQKKFITECINDTQTRLYKTGDLCRRLPNQAFEYIGRVDNQVKIRGFRIELGEIESHLTAHPAIDIAVVLAKETHTHEQQLIAYYILSPSSKTRSPSSKTRSPSSKTLSPSSRAQRGISNHEALSQSKEIPRCARDDEAISRDDELTIKQLRQYLSKSLPDYMIPTAFIKMDHLPLTKNGKLNPSAFPTPHFALSQQSLAPATPLEKQLAKIWSDELGISPIGLNDDFFELGGHSLTAARVISQINASFKKEVSVRDLYTAPTIASFITHLNQAKNTKKTSLHSIKKSNDKAAYFPLSDFQLMLWISNTFEPKAKKLNVTARKRIAGRLDITALTSAFEAVLKKHEILLSRVLAFRFVQALQKNVSFTLVEKNIEHLSTNAHTAVLDESLEQLSTHYPWKRGAPMVMMRLFYLKKNESELQLSLPHLIADDFSTDLLLSDLSKFYLLHLSQGAIHKVMVDRQYRHYILNEQHYLHTHLDRDILFWETYLKDAQLFAFPKQQMMIKKRSQTASYSTYYEIPEKGLTQLKAFCASHHVSMYDGLCAAVTLALFQCCSDDKLNTQPIFMNIVKSTRDNPYYDEALGCFLRLEPIKVEMNHKATLASLSQQVHLSVRDTQAYQRCSGLVKLGSVSTVRESGAQFTQQMIRLFIYVYTMIFRIPALNRKILAACSRLSLLKRHQHFLVNINVQRNFIEGDKYKDVAHLFGCETKNIDKPQADLLNIDQIFEACFLRNQGEHTPYLVISSNLKPAFRERIAKEVVRIIDCETSI